VKDPQNDMQTSLVYTKRKK